MLKTEIVLSLLLIIMGFIDCLTTVIGILYSGASELNPLMAGIVNINFGAFLIVKLASTMFIAGSYILANKILNMTKNKNSKSFKYSSKLLKVGYSGTIVFLFMVVANNLLVLLG
jgi:hypothetical protein